MSVLLAFEVQGELDEQFARIESALDAGRAAALESAATSLVDYIRTEKLTGSPIKSRTGGLEKSISAEVQDSEGETVATIRSSADYAHILEFGGEITARFAAHLTIPLQPLLGGSPHEVDVRELITDPATGGFTGVFAHNDILFGVLGRREISPLFKLQQSVELPPRSFFASALEENAGDILDLVRTSTSEAL